MTTLIPYSGSGSGFVKIGAFNTLFKHANFADRLLYKQVDTLQDAVACGGVAIFDSTGSKMAVYAGEALQAWVNSGASCRFPYPTVSRSEGEMEQVYGSGWAVKSTHWVVDGAKWIDYSAEAASWYFLGVVTKMTSMVGVSSALDIPYAMNAVNTFTTFAELLSASRKIWAADARTGISGVAGLNTAPPDQYPYIMPYSGKDVLGAWLGVPWHSKMKAFIQSNAADAIGSGDGAEYIRTAHEQLFAQYVDGTPLLNLVFASYGTKMAFSRSARRACVVEPIALAATRVGNSFPGDVSVHITYMGVSLSSELGCVNYFPAYTPMSPTVPYHNGSDMTIAEYCASLAGGQRLTSELGHSTSYSRNMGLPLFVVRNHGIGDPLVTQYGRVPSIGCSLTRDRLDNAGSPSVFVGFGGREITNRPVPAKLGGWDMRPFISTCLPRLYFKDTGEADMTVGLDMAIGDIINTSGQTVIETHQRNVTSEYTGTKENADARNYIDVDLVSAERWPYDVVGTNTKYWNQVYDLAEQLAKQ